MVTKVVILGASGGCLDVIDAINEINKFEKGRYEIIGLLEDNKDLQNNKFSGLTIIGGMNDISNIDQNVKIVNALGSEKNFYKKEKLILEILKIEKNRLETLIHPKASVAESAVIGSGSIIYQNVSIGRNVTIGNNVIILPNSFIGHDTQIGDFSILNAGVAVSGSVKISSNCYIGTNTCIKNNVEIENCSLIGMGSNVTKNIRGNSISYGNPCKYISKLF